MAAKDLALESDFPSQGAHVSPGLGVIELCFSAHLVSSCRRSSLACFPGCSGSARSSAPRSGTALCQVWALGKAERLAALPQVGRLRRQRNPPQPGLTFYGEEGMLEKSVNFQSSWPCEYEGEEKTLASWLSTRTKAPPPPSPPLYFQPLRPNVVATPFHGLSTAQVPARR